MSLNAINLDENEYVEGKWVFDFKKIVFAFWFCDKNMTGIYWRFLLKFY